jgi:hypothetical protein
MLKEESMRGKVTRVHATIIFEIVPRKKIVGANGSYRAGKNASESSECDEVVLDPATT